MGEWRARSSFRKVYIASSHKHLNCERERVGPGMGNVVLKLHKLLLRKLTVPELERKSYSSEFSSISAKKSLVIVDLHEQLSR